LISLRRGRGCPECQRTPRKTDSEVRSILEKEGYLWVSGTYDSAFTPLGLVCPNGHNIKMRLHSFLNSGTRCSGCCETGFDQTKPGILYYLRFENDRQFYYKIGITNLSAAIRFKSEKTPFKIIKESYYEWGEEALQEEARILKDYKKYKYLGAPFLRNGNSELFTKDVLLLDEEFLDKTFFEELA
jgi:hypothetical protein